MEFKDTKYGNLTGKEYKESIFIINKNLTSLKGSPKKVCSSFDCSHNDLILLKFCPEEINGTFDCSENMIETFKYSPKIVTGNFNCSYNKLISLKGGPKIVMDGYNCSNNMLKTLEGVTEEINGVFNCSKNNISSLKYRPKKSSIFNCKNNVFLKKPKQQIIENSILSRFYITDEGSFTFKEIEKEFLKHIKLLKSKNFKDNFENKDFGFSL